MMCGDRLYPKKASRSLLICGVAGLLCLAGLSLGQDADLAPADTYGEAGTRQGTFLEQDSAMGTFTIGVAGLSDSERRQATIGDLEVGYVQLYELDQMFPRVIELRPFALNRFESTEQSAYESLGVGGGIRLAVRQKYSKNYGFIRGTVVTPTEYYNEFYNADRKQSSIVELFVGFEVPFNDSRTNRDIYSRTLNPYPVVINVSPALLREQPPRNPLTDTFADIQAMIVRQYLRQALQDFVFGQKLVGQRNGGEQIDFTNPWQVFRFLELLAVIEMSELDKAVVYEGKIAGETGQEYRKELAEKKLRQGLTAMMRGPYPLLFKVAQEPNPDPNVAVKARGQTTVVMSQPGMSLGGKSSGLLDSDRMIEAYVDWFVQRYVVPSETAD